MAMKEHKIDLTIWATYYKGQYYAFNVAKAETDMAVHTGWVKVSDVQISVRFDTEANQATTLVAQLDIEISKMRAKAEAAINEKLDERNKLLCLEMRPVISDDILF